MRVDVCDVKSLALVLSNPVNTKRDSFAEDTRRMRRPDERDVSLKKKRNDFQAYTVGIFVCVSVTPLCPGLTEAHLQ